MGVQESLRRNFRPLIQVHVKASTSACDLGTEACSWRATWDPALLAAGRHPGTTASAPRPAGVLADYPSWILARPPREAGQEATPEGLVMAVAHIGAEHLEGAVDGDAGSTTTRHRERRPPRWGHRRCGWVHRGGSPPSSRHTGGRLGRHRRPSLVGRAIGGLLSDVSCPVRSKISPMAPSRTETYRPTPIPATFRDSY